MIAFVFRRRLRAGVTFEEFKEGWKAEKGYPVKNRVLNATRNDDNEEVFTVGFLDMPKMFAGMALKKGTDQDSVETDRHDRVDEVIGETLMRAQYQVVAEYDLTDRPRSIRPGSKGSMMHFKHANESDGVAGGQMLASIAVHQLREGLDLKALAAARLAGEQRAPGCRVLDLRNLKNDREILTIAFLPGADGEISADTKGLGEAGVSNVTEAPSWSSMYTFRSEHDFKKVPVEVPVCSPQSILNF